MAGSVDPSTAKKLRVYGNLVPMGWHFTSGNTMPLGRDGC